MKKPEIPVFEFCNDLHEAIDFPHRSHMPNFDIYSLQNMGPTVKKFMPPYRQRFYQIAIMNDLGESKMNLNTDWVKVNELPLVFAVPGQIVSWYRDTAVKGYHILFKKDFLKNVSPNFTEDFPFLKITESNILLLTKEEHESLYIDSQRMQSVFNKPHPYQEKMLEGMLLSFLYFCKAIFERHKLLVNNLTRAQVITQEFEALVEKLYIETKNVSDYADQLNITPNYLSTMVKSLAGKNAKDIINDRVLLESKSLLKFSRLDIAEIAYSLNFQEPTHFTRFFKKLTGITPNRFRKSI